MFDPFALEQFDSDSRYDGKVLVLQGSGHKAHTANPRISPRGLICKNEFLGGGLFDGKD